MRFFGFSQVFERDTGGNGSALERESTLNKLAQIGDTFPGRRTSLGQRHKLAGYIALVAYGG